MTNQMKRFFAVFMAMALCLTLAAGAAAEDKISVYALKGPTGIGMVQMMAAEDSPYAFTLAGAPDEVVAAVVSGEADIAAVPTNLAATLYNKTQGGVNMLALNTLGVLSILEKGDSVQSVQDLAGKTIYATGQGSTPEYVLNYILAANGLTDQVTVEYKAEHAELATLAASGEVDLVMLPEPNVTSVLMQNADFRIALDVTALYGEAAAASGHENAVLSMGCVIVGSEFAEAHPEEVAAFMAAYEESVAFVNGNVEEASKLVEAQGVLPKAAVAQRAIPNCHIVFVSGEEMRTQIEPFFQLLFDANPKAVGGAIPGDDFYYIAQ